MPNRNALIGNEVERLFKNSIGRQPDVLALLRSHFEINGEFAMAFSTGPDFGKSDVMLRFTNGRTLSANIKAYQAGFNQLTRTTIASFCSEFDLDDYRQTFEEGAVRVAGRQGRFISEDDVQSVADALRPLAKRIVHFALSRLEDVDLFILFNRQANVMNIYDMKELLENLNYEIAITPRGVVKIGSYVTIQRKGGNGVHSVHIEKTSLAHPGNNLQVKMKVGSFVADTTPLVSYIP